jgi:membrane protein DedA with SNARE-associated domain
MAGSMGPVGYSALGAMVLLSAAFAPLPVSVALAAAGALAREGRLDLALVFVIATVAAVGGDVLGYAVGRCSLGPLPLPAWSGAALSRLRRPMPAFRLLDAHMGMLLFLTRWALTAPAPLVNLLAGARRYPWRSFLVIDLAGQTLWCGATIGLGYGLGEDGEISLPLSMGMGLMIGLLGILASKRFGRPAAAEH